MLEALEKRKVATSENKEVWLTARMTGVTASDASNLEEGSKIESLVYKKLNNTFKGNAWTDWGLEREPFLIEWSKSNPNSTLFRSELEPRFMATPDGIKIVNGEIHLVQAKTTSKGWTDTPANYVRQCQWEMFVMGATQNTLVWEQHQNFVPTDLEPKSLVIYRDDAEIARLIQLAYKFLEELDKQNKEGN